MASIREGGGEKISEEWCVWVRERDRERERAKESQREQKREREGGRERESSMNCTFLQLDKILHS